MKDIFHRPLERVKKLPHVRQYEIATAPRGLAMTRKSHCERVSRSPERSEGEAISLWQFFHRFLPLNVTETGFVTVTELDGSAVG
jgi:hypothetical protein